MADPEILDTLDIVTGKSGPKYPPVVVPVSAAFVSRLTFYYALNNAGLRPAWDAALAAASQNVRDYFAAKVTFPLDNPKVQRAAQAARIDLAALALDEKGS